MDAGEDRGQGAGKEWGWASGVGAGWARREGSADKRTRGTRLLLREPCLPRSSTLVPEGAREGSFQGPSG